MRKSWKMQLVSLDCIVCSSWVCYLLGLLRFQVFSWRTLENWCSSRSHTMRSIHSSDFSRLSVADSTFLTDLQFHLIRKVNRTATRTLEPCWSPERSPFSLPISNATIQTTGETHNHPADHSSPLECHRRCDHSSPLLLQRCTSQTAESVSQHHSGRESPLPPIRPSRSIFNTTVPSLRRVIINGDFL
jgi:hypothetical protein